MQKQPVSGDDCKVFQIDNAWYCYVPIMKVSSTYLRRALPGERFNIDTWQWYFNPQATAPGRNNMNFLVALRDPVQRWISGVVEFWCRAYPDLAWQPEDNYNWLFDQVEFDIHTQPQVDFLSHVIRDRCSWLWTGDAIEINTWFNQHDIKLNPVTESDRNLGSSRPLIYFGPNKERSYEPLPGYIPSVPSALIQSTVRQLLNSNPRYVERIKDYYHDDYNLIESVGLNTI